MRVYEEISLGLGLIMCQGQVILPSESIRAMAASLTILGVIILVGILLISYIIVKHISNSD